MLRMGLNERKGPVRLCALWLLACPLVVAQPSEPAPQPPTRPPVESFYKLPDLGDAELSPSGRWLAVTVPARNGRVALAIFDFATSRMASVTNSPSRPSAGRFRRARQLQSSGM